MTNGSHMHKLNQEKLFGMTAHADLKTKMKLKHVCLLFEVKLVRSPGRVLKQLRESNTKIITWVEQQSVSSCLPLVHLPNQVSQECLKIHKHRQECYQLKEI